MKLTNCLLAVNGEAALSPTAAIAQREIYLPYDGTYQPRLDSTYKSNKIPSPACSKTP